ncbi:MAG TPA: methyltransferase domain-containing protein [Chloroflexia bacterium]|jgi:ubiquinone/menaquinone biosynthesis C-methylase UbiE
MSEERVSSYNASEMPIGLDSELERLRQQALMTWEKEARNLRWWGLQDDMSVLELGNGPGFVTEQLARLVPRGKVTGLEIDPVLIQKAQDYLRGNTEGTWELVQGNVMSMDLPDDTFDFAYGRYLFQHLPDPVGAAREVLRVLKPGGKLVIADVDDQLNIFDPPAGDEVKALDEKIEKAMREEQASKGGNRLVGRSLLRILTQAGFDSLDIEAIIAHSQLVDLRQVVPPPTPEQLQPLVGMGIITEEEVGLIITEAERFEASDPVIMLPLLLACGQKPKTG